MTLLAIDFSTSLRSIAIVAVEGENCRLLLKSPTPGTEHSLSSSCPGYENVNSAVDTLLAGANLSTTDIDFLAIGIGPGSYTGIRASIAFAQGWNLATGLKLAPVSTLDALALQAPRREYTSIHILVDAQRNEYYHADYEVDQYGVPQNTTPLAIISVGDAQKLLASGRTVVGPDIQKNLPGTQPLYPEAIDIAEVALRQNRFCAPEDLVPIYLRPTEFVKAAPMRKLPL